MAVSEILCVLKAQWPPADSTWTPSASILVDGPHSLRDKRKRFKQLLSNVSEDIFNLHRHKATFVPCRQLQSKTLVFFCYARWHVDGYVPSYRKDNRKLISLFLITEERSFNLKWALSSTQFMVLSPNINKRNVPKAGSTWETEQMLPELMAAGHSWLGCVQGAASLHRGWCCWGQGLSLLLLG